MFHPLWCGAVIHVAHLPVHRGKSAGGTTAYNRRRSNTRGRWMFPPEAQAHGCGVQGCLQVGHRAERLNIGGTIRRDIRQLHRN